MPLLGVNGVLLHRARRERHAGVPQRDPHAHHVRREARQRTHPRGDPSPTMSPRPDSLRGTTITGTGMYVPDRVLTNHDLEKIVDTTDEWIVERTGIRERRIAAPDQASSDLALHRLPARAGDGEGGREGRRPDHPRDDDARPHPALVRVHAAAASWARRSAAAYDMFAACTGFIFGMGHRARAHRRRHGRHRAGGRRRDAVAHRGLHRPQHLRAVRRRRRRGGVPGVRAGPGHPRGGHAQRRRAGRGARGARGHLAQTRPATQTVAAARALHPHAGQEALPVRGAQHGGRDAQVLRARRAGRRATWTCSSRTRRTCASSTACASGSGLPTDKVYVNIDRYGNTSSASIPIALDEVVRARPREARRQARVRGVRRRRDVGREHDDVDAARARARPRWRRHPRAGEARREAGVPVSRARARRASAWAARWPRRTPAAREAFATADRVLGYALSALCWNGPAEDLKKSVHTQPALLTHSVAAWRLVRRGGAHAGVRAPGTAWASTRRASRPARCRSRTRCA